MTVGTVMSRPVISWFLSTSYFISVFVRQFQFPFVTNSCHDSLLNNYEPLLTTIHSLLATIQTLRKHYWPLFNIPQRNSYLSIPKQKWNEQQNAESYTCLHNKRKLTHAVLCTCLYKQSFNFDITCGFFGADGGAGVHGDWGRGQDHSFGKDCLPESTRLPGHWGYIWPHDAQDW